MPLAQEACTVAPASHEAAQASHVAADQACVQLMLRP